MNAFNRIRTIKFGLVFMVLALSFAHHLSLSAMHDAKGQENIKGTWTPAENKCLTKLYTKFKNKGYEDKDIWSKIVKTKKLKRSKKQCKARWCGHLDPKIKREKFSPEEEQIMDEMLEEMGGAHHWTKIAKRLPGRTDGQIKNRFWAEQRRKDEAAKKEKLDRRKAKKRKKSSSLRPKKRKRIQHLASEPSNEDVEMFRSVITSIFENYENQSSIKTSPIPDSSSTLPSCPPVPLSDVPQPLSPGSYDPSDQ